MAYQEGATEERRAELLKSITQGQMSFERENGEEGKAPSHGMVRAKALQHENPIMQYYQVCAMGPRAAVIKMARWKKEIKLCVPRAGIC